MKSTGRLNTILTLSVIWLAGSGFVGDLTGRAPQLFAQVPGYSSPERFPQPVSGGPVVTAAPPTAPDNFGAPGAGSGLIPGPNPGTGVPATDPNWNLPAAPPSYGGLPEPPTAQYIPENRYADLDAIVRETQTGRFQFGVGVNSDAGVTGQIVIDERNFDWQRLPTSGSDVLNGTGFRGAGQGFRIEAMPGNQVQRYMVSFTEPYLFGYSPISLNLSGFFFQRGYFDYSEERLGGRGALGYRLSPDLSIAGALRAESVDIYNPRVSGVTALDRIVGTSQLYSGRLTLTSDTRDIPFFPTEGRYIELALEQGFGTLSFPRAEVDLRRYYLIRQRPDTSGRHTLALGLKLGFSGSDTPMYENYFAGGFSTLRGFNFRGASPVENTVVTGGPFRLLGSAEYFFPLTADDMVKGVVFCDYGSVESEIALHWDQFRVSPGFGLRISIPALGPAPLALDFAVPIAHANGDNIQNFSFFFGFGR
ncbi:MAG: BamA/TamA family outer membrane protein [Planctomycetota bacterium]